MIAFLLGAWSASLACAAAPAGGRGPDTPHRLDADAARPAWEHAAPSGIEWVARVGPPQRPLLLCATPGGALALLDAQCGSPLTATPAESQPTAATLDGLTMIAARGVRLADGPAADTAYCFDRHRVYAIALTPPFGLRWTHGTGPRDIAAFPGDPEVLSGWVAACAIAGGPLLVDRGGRVEKLAAEDGRVIWSANLPRTDVVRLYTGDGAPAALIRSEGTTYWARFLLCRMGNWDLTPERSQPDEPGRSDEPDRRSCGSLVGTRVLPDGWPIWSNPTLYGLLYATPSELVFMSDAEQTRRKFDGLTATGLHLVDADSGSASRPDAHPLLLREVVLAHAAGIEMLRLPTCARVWHTPWGERGCPDTRALHVGGGICVVYGPGYARVLDVRDGRLCWEAATDASSEFVSVWAADGTVRLLERHTAEQTATDAEDERARYRLRTAVASSQPVSEAVESLQLPPGYATARPHHIAWLPKHVVLVFADRMVAYRTCAEGE